MILDCVAEAEERPEQLQRFADWLTTDGRAVHAAAAQAAAEQPATFQEFTAILTEIERGGSFLFRHVDHA